MTDAVEESKAAAEELKPAGKQRSPLEKAVVWGGIGLLILLVFFEYNSRTKYEAAKQWAMDNEYAGKTLTETREAFAGARESDFKDELEQQRDNLDTEGIMSTGADTQKKFKWPSLFMTYELVVTFEGVAENAKMTSFYNPKDLEAVQAEQDQKFSQETSGSAPPDLGAFGQNGPIPGGGRGGEEPGDSEPGDSESGDSESGDSEPGDSEPGDSEPGESGADAGTSGTEEATEEDSEVGTAADTDE